MFLEKTLSGGEVTMILSFELCLLFKYIIPDIDIRAINTATKISTLF